MQKNLLKISLILCLLSVTACTSRPKASSPLEAFLATYISGPLQQESIQPYFDSEAKFASKLQVYEAGIVNEESYTKLAKLTRDFTYEILEEKVDKTKAVITMKFTFHDIAKVYRTWIEEVLPLAIEWVFEGKSEEEILQTQFRLLNDALESSSRDRVETIEVHMNYVEKEWRIVNSEINMPLFNVLTGGFLDMLGNTDGEIAQDY